MTETSSAFKDVTPSPRSRSTFWRDWVKGMTLNLLYEGQAIFYKLCLFWVGFFALQLALGVRAAKSEPFVYLEDQITYLSLSAVLANTLVPYFFVAFLLLAMVGSTAYLFWKDSYKAQPYYALRTLPVPRSCSFWAKPCFVLLSVVGVYAMQFLALMVLLQWELPYRTFRTGEWLLSVSEGGFLTWFFPPDLRMLLMASFLLFVMALVYVNGLFLAGRITKNYLAPIVSVVVLAWLLLSDVIGNLNFHTCLAMALSLLVLASICLWDAYRNY